LSTRIYGIHNIAACIAISTEEDTLLLFFCQKSVGETSAGTFAALQTFTSMNSQKYAKVRKSTQKYAKVRKSTQKYAKVQMTRKQTFTFLWISTFWALLISLCQKNGFSKKLKNN
jgi:UDP-N-acetylmuramyl pentapeptide phosphotransferase/UDP-N-acetylglucosamine-1-phosphate transferase